MSLSTRVAILLTALLLTTLGGGVLTLWFTETTDQMLSSLVEKNLASFRASEDLENSLLLQKGNLTYFYLDGNQQWIKELDQHHQRFQAALLEARKSASHEPMGKILDQIDSAYQKFLTARQKVIELYQAGDRESGFKLHQDVRLQFAAIRELTQRYKVINEYAVATAQSDSRRRARYVNSLSLAAIVGVMGLGTLLAYILWQQILTPIRRLAQETNVNQVGNVREDEVTILSRRVHHLLEDVDQAHSELEKSQETLLQAEKMALVGKLAAGVAHSIRNPLTSVKMRLFSLQRTLALTPTQKDDLEVIAQEVRHIDTIVRHFLEFSRPPQLKMQRVSLSDVVDRALTLLGQRLEAYGVRVTLNRQERLPATWADPEQLQEVLVNLLLNACEAMPGGGLITVREARGQVASEGPVVFLRLSDTGPGIPESIRDKIFQPFFSTKEEGTGLGLSIAQRIVREHGGWIELQSREGEGTTFIITLPLKDEDTWAPSS